MIQWGSPYKITVDDKTIIVLAILRGHTLGKNIPCIVCRVINSSDVQIIPESVFVKSAKLIIVNA